MSQTGIQINEECKIKFDELKRSTHFFVVFKMNPKLTEVIVDTVGPPSSSYDQFLMSLPEDDCRYAVMNLRYSLPDGSERAKMVFFFVGTKWCKGEIQNSLFRYKGTFEEFIPGHTSGDSGY